MNSDDELYKLELYVPESHLESVKSAMFAAGAGRVGDYDCCAWQTLGRGQFRPLAGSNPYLGETGQIEESEEYKLEMVCLQSCLQQTVRAMKEAHPYEEVAYAVLRLETAYE